MDVGSKLVRRGKLIADCHDFQPLSLGWQSGGDEAGVGLLRVPIFLTIILIYTQAVYINYVATDANANGDLLEVEETD